MPAQIGGLNILPKKSWHVRTKENIAKVRRDEAKAAEEERQILERAALAEQEARTALLRQRARDRVGPAAAADDIDDYQPSTSAKLEHVNFFAEIEEEEKNFGKNKGHELDKKDEKEKWEKQIGLLKYLGEGTRELTGTVPWYEQIDPKREWRTIDKSAKSNFSGSSSLVYQKLQQVKEERSEKRRKKRKRAYSSSSGSSIEEISRKRKKSKKSKKSEKSKKSQKAEYSRSSTASVEKLRAERLKREAAEKKKTQNLMRSMSGLPSIPDEDKTDEKPVFEQKYNSQFNPEFCRQNKR